MVPSSPTVQVCALVPLQVHSCTAVPLALLAPATSTHLPPKPVIAPVPAAWAVPPVIVTKVAAASAALTRTASNHSGRSRVVLGCMGRPPQWEREITDSTERYSGIVLKSI
jgi:hypothetical protein